jgi:hypothetical protein
MNPTVYIETTIISYLTAWPSNDAVRAAHQVATREWWDHERVAYQLCTSEVARVEASAGDPVAAAERVAVLDQLRLLPVTPEARQLAGELLARTALPATEDRDAAHIAVAATNGVDYLLTWNCRHLANATLRTRIEMVCRSLGYEPPVICTPLELREVKP